MGPDRRRRVTLIAAATFFVAAGAALYFTLTGSGPPRATGFPATGPGQFAGTYFVGGHVKRPGAYTPGGAPVTVRQAILMAGGADDSMGPRSFVIVYRRLPGDAGEVEVIKINLRPLLDAGVNDETLWPNDQVIVHDNG